MHLNRRDVEGDEEPDAAKQIHDDLTECVVDGFICTRVADKQERADGRDLPAGEHPHHVVREHDDEHRREEQEHEREERGAPVLGTFWLMGLEIDHVSEGVHADAAADDADDERHDDRQRINVETGRLMHSMSKTELVHERPYHLYYCKSGGKLVLVLDAKRNDDGGDSNAYCRANIIDNGRRELEKPMRRSEVLHREQYRSYSYDRSRYAHDDVSWPVSFDQQQQCRNNQRKDDKKCD